jgi:hypothetical protein
MYANGTPALPVCIPALTLQLASCMPALSLLQFGEAGLKQGGPGGPGGGGPGGGFQFHVSCRVEDLG